MMRKFIKGMAWISVGVFIFSFIWWGAVTFKFLFGDASVDALFDALFIKAAFIPFLGILISALAINIFYLVINKE